MTASDYIISGSQLNQLNSKPLTASSYILGSQLSDLIKKNLEERNNIKLDEQNSDKENDNDINSEKENEE